MRKTYDQKEADIQDKLKKSKTIKPNTGFELDMMGMPSIGIPTIGMPTIGVPTIGLPGNIPGGDMMKSMGTKIL
jgi:hypothetical protein